MFYSLPPSGHQLSDTPDGACHVEEITPESSITCDDDICVSLDSIKEPMHQIPHKKLGSRTCLQFFCFAIDPRASMLQHPFQVNSSKSLIIHSSCQLADSFMGYRFHKHDW